MTPIQRRLLEERLAEFKQALADPWRLFRCLEEGNDPIICQATERQIEALIDEMEAELRTADMAKDV